MAIFSEFSAMFHGIRHRKIGLLAALAAVCSGCAGAQEPVTQNVVQSYADLVGLAESSPLVVFAELKKVIRSLCQGMLRPLHRAKGLF
jgi:hypothetical protein